MSVKKFSFILKTAKIFHQNLPTQVKEHDVSLFWLSLYDMPSTSRLALCIWHIHKARVKYIGSVGSLVDVIKCTRSNAFFLPLLMNAVT